jgi:hypothetical protein
LLDAELNFLDPPFEVPDSEKVNLRESQKYSLYRKAPDYTPLASEMEKKLQELEQELKREKVTKE